MRRSIIFAVLLASVFTLATVLVPSLYPEDSSGFPLGWWTYTDYSWIPFVGWFFTLTSFQFNAMFFILDFGFWLIIMLAATRLLQQHSET